MKYFLGIDPGQSGGWAMLGEDGTPEIEGYGLFAEEPFIRSNYDPYFKNIVLACLEKVHAMPGQGVSSMFKFGTNFGWWQGVMDALEIPYELITPQRWMKTVLDSGDRKPEHRMEFARRRWPDVSLKRKKDSGVVDALCLAEYARLRSTGGAE